MPQKDGADISPWHDIALFNEDGTLNFFCEIPMDTTAKYEVATVRFYTYGLTSAHSAATRPQAARVIHRALRISSSQGDGSLAYARRPRH